MRSIKYLVLLLALTLIAAACTPIQPEGAAPAAAPSEPSAADFAKPGPHAAGYQAVVIEDGNGDALDASLWYPALNADGANADITYDVLIKAPEMQGDGAAVVYGQALRDAPVDDNGGPYPLVIFSHGFGLNAPAYHTLPEHYASYGFAVLAPEHMESDWFDGVAHTVERPRDIVRALDFAEALNADGALAGRIDLDNVAVVGHSYGGYTALAAGGAQIDFDAFSERCGALAEDDPKMFLCAPLLGKGAELAQGFGLADAPAGLWPLMGDERVDAILPMAGDAFLFGEDGLAGVTVPMMAIGGTADTGTPFDWGSGLAYDHAGSAQKSLVGLAGAEHMIVASPCADMPWLETSPIADYLCGDPAWDKQAALDLVHHFSTAFLLDTLTGDAEAHAALRADAAQFEGVEYSTTLQ